MALKLAGEAMDSRNKVASEASRLFFVLNFFAMKFLVSEVRVATKVFFVVATIVPVPIPCTGHPLEAGLILCSLGGTEGGFRRRCRMEFGVVGNYWWQGQNAFSEKLIGELLRFVG